MRRVACASVALGLLAGLPAQGQEQSHSIVGVEHAAIEAAGGELGSGVVTRWDASGATAAFDAAFGAGGWRILSIELSMSRPAGNTGVGVDAPGSCGESLVLYDRAGADGRGESLAREILADGVATLAFDGAGPGAFRAAADGLLSGATMTLVAGEIDCPADCNENDSLDLLDYICFQNAWTSQDAYGDCDGNGEYDVLDFVCYQQLFFAGWGTEACGF